jgi:hypothetical protein
MTLNPYRFEGAMTKAEKIYDMLEWSLCGCNISPENEKRLRAQFAAKSDAEIDELYASQMRRRRYINERRENRP